MILSLNIVGQRELFRNLSQMPSAVRTLLLVKVRTLVEKLEGRVIQKLSGEVLSPKSGMLRDSVYSTVIEEGGIIEGEVVAGEGVPYAAILEKGGQTSAHLILPKAKSVLRFTKNGQEIFATRVLHPGSVIPAKSYMRSSYREMSSEISNELKKAAVQGIRQSMRGG